MASFPLPIIFVSHKFIFDNPTKKKYTNKIRIHTRTLILNGFSIRFDVEWAHMCAQRSPSAMLNWINGIITDIWNEIQYSHYRFRCSMHTWLIITITRMLLTLIYRSFISTRWENSIHIICVQCVAIYLDFSSCVTSHFRLHVVQFSFVSLSN